MELSPSTRLLLQKILRANEVPEMFWSPGLKKTAKVAEPYAAKRGHHFIKDEDVMDALKEITPPEHRKQLLDILEKAHVDTDKWFSDWK